jgi:hypothetical protein
LGLRELNLRRQWDECDQLLQLLDDMQRLGWTMPDASLIEMLKTLRTLPPFENDTGSGPMKLATAIPLSARRKTIPREKTAQAEV